MSERREEIREQFRVAAAEIASIPVGTKWTKGEISRLAWKGDIRALLLRTSNHLRRKCACEHCARLRRPWLWRLRRRDKAAISAAIDAFVARQRAGGVVGDTEDDKP